MNLRASVGLARSSLCWLGLGLSAAACGGPPPKAADQAEGPVTERESGAAAREKVGITVYNQNFGLVREIRKVPLGKGRVSLEFADVSAHIQPETVHIRALGAANAFTVLEQNYRYDLLTPAKLLEKHVGKQVKVYRYNEKLGTEEMKRAEVLSVEGGIVLKIDGEVTYDFPGRIAFPSVPENLISKPTLVWMLGSTVAEQRVEVTYLTRNLNWVADYVFVVDAKDERGDLTGWVTLTNESGASYERAELKLVAGDVQKLAPRAPDEMDSMVRAPAPSGAAQFKEEGFFEYHLYTLARPTSLLDKEKKQVTLLEGRGVGVNKKLIFYGAAHYYRGQYGQVVSNQKVGVYLDIENSQKNKLGMPLPKGTVRVYKADASGAQQFIGEDAIDHTPKDEEIRIKMGEAFDVIGDRKQMEWRPFGHCVSESSWEIELRNHKHDAVRVLVSEPIGGDWEVLSSSHKHKKEDAHTFTFDVPVPAHGKTQVTYRTRVRWC
jgi:hypothetical protein